MANISVPLGSAWTSVHVVTMEMTPDFVYKVHTRTHACTHTHAHIIIVNLMLCLLSFVSGNDFFFNQTSFNFKSSVNDIFDTPILSAILYIDKNMTTESPFQVFLYGPYAFIHSDSTTFWYPLTFLLSNDFSRIRLKIENADSDITSIWFQSQTFNGTNRSECVAGSRTLLMVGVEVYAVSITGLFSVSLYAARFRSPFSYRLSASVIASGTVDSGEYSCHLVYIFVCGM